MQSGAHTDTLPRPGHEASIDMNASEIPATGIGLAAVNSCVAPTRLPDTIPPVVDYVQATTVLITMILAIIMNGFVIYLVARHKVLHQMAFYLALQIIVAHLILSVIVLPFIFVTAVLREWRLGLVMCQLLGSIHDTVITSRYLLTFVLTMDRVISVFYPFFYLRHGGKISICNSIIAWTLSLARSVTSLEGVMSCTKYLPIFKMCSGAPFCSETCRIHILIFSAILAAFGVVIPFFLYIVLFFKAKMIRYRFTNSIQIQQDSSSSVPSNDGMNPAAAQSQSDSRKIKHNHRATWTFVILTAVIIGCALPPYILYTVENNIPGTSPPVLTILQIIVGRTLVHCLAVADPIVILRNRDVRELIHRRAIRFLSTQSLSTGKCFSSQP